PAGRARAAGPRPRLGGPACRGLAGAGAAPAWLGRLGRRFLIRVAQARGRRVSRSARPVSRPGRPGCSLLSRLAWPACRPLTRAGAAPDRAWAARMTGPDPGGAGQATARVPLGAACVPAWEARGTAP